MRVAIFSDVHGNAVALEAILRDIKAQGMFDKLIFAGDLIYGAHLPLQCIDLLQEFNVISVYGNTDEFLWIEQERDDKSSDEEWNAYLEYLNWLKGEIGKDGFDFLRQMPFEQRLCPTEEESNDLLIVHANPKDVQQVIWPSENVQQEKLGRIIQTDKDLVSLLEGIGSKTIAFGHIHIPTIRTIGGYRLINIASVSMPQDGNWRAKYSILTFKDREWHPEQHYVEYDVVSVKRDLIESDIPMATIFANRLMLR